MTTQTLRRLRRADSTSILEDLTRRQYLIPHKQVGDVLTEMATVYGLKLGCVHGAGERLGLAADASVGRLTRAQLADLAQAIHRVHRHALLGRPAAC